MYLSNRDIKWAIDRGHLIVDPRPESFGAGYDGTSIDLHLENVREAKIWDIAKFAIDQMKSGNGPELSLGDFQYTNFSGIYLVPPPEEDSQNKSDSKVIKRGRSVIVKPGGFLLWVTKEKIGTPEGDPRLVCFVNAKSTKARTGVVVHLSAPTIHAGWSGKITLEIANHGPFDLVLKENDAIAQLTVAQISSSPDLSLQKTQSQTSGQIHASGSST